jgi:Tol biopolymer transport system component
MRSRSLVSGKVVLLLAITLGLAAVSAPAWATFPGTNGRIAFASNGTGDLDVYTMNPDGSDVVNVTADPSIPGFDFEPDWSPDGTKIAFRSGQGAAGEIYTMNADGTGLTQLTSNSLIKDYSPAWSPDGSMIAFSSNRNDPHPDTCIDLAGCNDDIFVMPATGGSPIQVTFDSGADEFPQFSPDGTLIAYQSEVSGEFAIYTVNLGTLAVTKLTADSLKAVDPDYSPDGTKIAFANNYCLSAKNKPKDCRSDIFVMNADGGSVTQLTHTSGNNQYTGWSPEGDKIVFSHSNFEGTKAGQIYVMNSDGTGLTRITQTNDDSFVPDWGTG